MTDDLYMVTNTSQDNLNVHTHTAECWKLLAFECVDYHIRTRDKSLGECRGHLEVLQSELRSIQSSAVRMDNKIRTYLSE